MSILLRREVRLFADEMERVLRLNDQKEHWSYLPIEDLLDRLEEEVEELREALESDGEVEIEAVDIANFAMMIADNFGRIKED